MNILAHGSIFLLLVFCYSALCLHEEPDPSKDYTIIKAAGTPLRVRPFLRKAIYQYGIIERYKKKSCYHICGIRKFVQASHFYDFSGFERGYIVLKHHNGRDCLVEFEITESYSFLENNNDFCLCLEPHVQNVLYLAAGFPELHFPPINRLVNESQFYDRNLDPEDVYLTRSPCEGDTCSVRVDPYLASTLNMYENQTVVVPGKRKMVSELDQILKDVEALKVELENAEQTRAQITKEKDIKEKILSALKANQSALREEVVRERELFKHLSNTLRNTKIKNNLWKEIDRLKEEIQRLKDVDEEKTNLLNQVKVLEADLDFSHQKILMLEDENKEDKTKMMQMIIPMEALQNENEKLRLEFEAKKQVVVELDRTKIDYQMTQERLAAMETRQIDLKSELQKTLDEVEVLRVTKAQLEKTMDSSRTAFDKLEKATLQISKLEGKLKVLLTEKRALEDEQQGLRSEVSNLQKEIDGANLRLKFCSQQVDELRKESKATVGELESLQRNRTETLRKEYKETVLRMEEKIQSVKAEVRDRQALVSKIKQEKEDVEDFLEKTQNELVRLRNENTELQIQNNETLKLLENTAHLQKVMTQTQEKVISLEDTNMLLEKEKALRQEHLNQVLENFNALKKENENQLQELKELDATRLDLQKLKSKFNNLEVERKLLEEKLLLFKTQMSILATENGDLKNEIRHKKEELEKLDSVMVEIRQVQSELTTIKLEKQKTKEELKDAQQKLTLLVEENDILKRDVQLKDEMRQRLMALEQETTHLHATLKELEAKKRQTEDALLAGREKMQELDAQNGDMRKTLESKLDLEKELESTKQIINVVQGKLIETEADKSVAQTQLSSLEKDLKDLKKELGLKSQAVEELERTKSELDRAQEKLFELNEQKRSAEEKWIQVQEQLEQLEKEIEQAKSEERLILHDEPEQDDQPQADMGIPQTQDTLIQPMETKALNEDEADPNSIQIHSSVEPTNVLNQPDVPNDHLKVKEPVVDKIPQTQATLIQPMETKVLNEDEADPNSIQIHSSVEPTNVLNQPDSTNDHLKVKEPVVDKDGITISQGYDSVSDDHAKPQDAKKKDDQPQLDGNNSLKLTTPTLTTVGEHNQLLNTAPQAKQSVTKPNDESQKSNSKAENEDDADSKVSRIHLSNAKTNKHGKNQQKKDQFKTKNPAVKMDKKPLSQANSISFERKEPTETSNFTMNETSNFTAENGKDEVSPGTRAELGKEDPGKESTESESGTDGFPEEKQVSKEVESPFYSSSMGYRKHAPALAGKRQHSPCNPQNEPFVHKTNSNSPLKVNTCKHFGNEVTQKETTSIMSSAMSHPGVLDDDEERKDKSRKSSGSMRNRYANIFVIAAVLATLA